MSDELRAALTAAGKELAKADAARDRALEKVAAALKAADGEVPVREMSRLAGVSHVTAYRLLER